MANMGQQGTIAATPTVCDGAYGTALTGALQPVDLACLRDPDSVVKLHEAYLSAGARRIQTNSFMAWSLPLGDRSVVYRAAVRCAELAARGATTPVDVMTTVGPVPGGVHEVRRELELALAAGARTLLVETVTTEEGAAAVLDAWDQVVAPGLTAILSMSVTPTSQPARGTWAWLGALEPRPGISFGLNCCAGATPELRAPLELLAERHHGMHLAPSAGLPGAMLAPAAWARALAELARGLPVASVGGCCGTTVAHVGALAAALSAGVAPARSAD